MVNKYKREESARYDIEQTIFRGKSVLFEKDIIEVNPHGYALLKQYLNPDKIVICPFCLRTETLAKFVISTKKGFNRWMGECPNCKNNVLFKTLLAMLKFTPIEYAKWVFGYRIRGFFQKIDFKQWTLRLFEMGISKEFWDEYKRLKGEEIE